jgi:hypothetical protein
MVLLRAFIKQNMGSSPVVKSLINIVVVYRTFNPGTRVRFPHQAGLNFIFFLASCIILALVR